MSWQKGRSSAEERSTVLGKVSTSLDAVSYIVALALVDALTFGAPAIPTTSNSEQSSPSSSYFTNTNTRRLSSPSTNLPRRRASEGDDYAMQTTSPGRQQKHQNQGRALNGSESSIYDWKYGNASMTEKDALRLSPTGSHDRSLHHYQKKIFGKQLQRTLMIQPFIKIFVICLLVLLIFLLYGQIFGIPRIIKSTTGSAFTYLISPMTQSLQKLLILIYGSIMAAAPLPRKKQTGWDLLMFYFQDFWIRALKLMRSSA